MNILSRLENARKQEVPKDQVYDAVMADIRVKALNSARLEARSEIDAAKAETLTAKAEAAKIEVERDAARKLLDLSEETVGSLKDNITQLKAVIKVEQESIDAKRIQMGSGVEGVKNELTAERNKAVELEKTIANLRGQLAAPKPIIQSPTPVPVFDFKPVRGQDGKIINVTATPRTN